MQQRRFRPGDVLDDYCPRERRITDHAIVAMIDDHIKQTRCVVCDAEHAYKEGKVPPQRRKKAQAALFNQVLDGLQGPQPAARLAQGDIEPDHDLVPEDSETLVQPARVPVPAVTGNGNGRAESESTTANLDRLQTAPATSVVSDRADVPVVPVVLGPAPTSETGPVRDEGAVRRSLIRATLPRPEGQPAPTRVIPEFTIRQPGKGRGLQRAGGRRRGSHHGHGGHGSVRFGRGQGQGQRQHGGRHHGPNGGRSRRGGKKR